MADQDTSIKAPYEGRVTRKRTRKDDTTNDSDDNTNNVRVVDSTDEYPPDGQISSATLTSTVPSSHSSASKTRTSNRLSNISRTVIPVTEVPSSTGKSTVKKSTSLNPATPSSFPTSTPLATKPNHNNPRTKPSLRRNPRKQTFPSSLSSSLHSSTPSSTTTVDTSFTATDSSTVYLGNLHGTPSTTVLPSSLLSNIHIATVRLAKLIRTYPLFRRWVYSEFLYNGIDRGFFLHNNFIENLALLHLSHVTKLNRTEWSTIRTIMYTIHQNAHNPRSVYYNYPTNKLSPRKTIRLSRNYLMKELAKLDRYRYDIRRVQMDMVPQLSSIDGPFVYQCPKPYVIGQRVTVIHPGHGYLCTGHISLVDIMYGYCTVQSDHEHDGFLRVSFTDVYPHNELELLYPALTSIPLHKYNHLYRKQRKQLKDTYGLDEGKGTRKKKSVPHSDNDTSDASSNDDDEDEHRSSDNTDDDEDISSVGEDNHNDQHLQQPAAYVPYDPWRLGLDPGYDLTYCSSAVIPSDTVTSLPVLTPLGKKVTGYPSSVTESIIHQNKEASKALYSKNSARTNNIHTKSVNLRYGYSQLDSSQTIFPSVGPSTRIAITEEGDLVLRTFSTITQDTTVNVDTHHHESVTVHPTVPASSSLSGTNTASSLSVISDDNSHDNEPTIHDNPNTSIHNTSISSMSQSQIGAKDKDNSHSTNVPSESLRRPIATHASSSSSSSSSSSANMAMDTMNLVVQTLPLLPMNKLGPATTHTVSFAAHCASTLSAARAEELQVIEQLTILYQQKNEALKTRNPSSVTELQSTIQYYQQLLLHLRKLQYQAGKATDEAMIQAGLLSASSVDSHPPKNKDNDDNEEVPTVSKLSVSNNSPFLNAIVSTSNTLATDAIGTQNTAKLLHMHTVERLDGVRIRCSIKAKQLTAKTVRNQLVDRYRHHHQHQNGTGTSSASNETATVQIKRYAEELTTQLLASSSSSSGIVPLSQIKQMVQLLITLQSVHDPGMTLSAVESFISTQRALTTVQPVHEENQALYTRLQGLVTKLRTVQYA